MKPVYCFHLILLILLLSYAQADTQESQEITLKEITCTAGSLQQLYDFFEQQQYVLVGQGRQSTEHQQGNDFADTLFLVSATMDYFHVVTLTPQENNKFEGCITTSAREIDLQILPPLAQLLPRNNREHLLFLPAIPENSACPEQDPDCVPWVESSALITRELALTGYEYSEKPAEDPYEEVVELTIGEQTIHPSRGELAELARKKYTLRLTNELGESEDDVEAAKEIYESILNDVDHKLPLIILTTKGSGQWKLYRLDRTSGLAWIVVQGDEFVPFPLKSDRYKKFTKNLN